TLELRVLELDLRHPIAGADFHAELEAERRDADGGERNGDRLLPLRELVVLVLLGLLVVGRDANDLKAVAVVAQTELELETLGRLESNLALDVEAGLFGVADLDARLLQNGVVLRVQIDADANAL